MAKTSDVLPLAAAPPITYCVPIRYKSCKCYETFENIIYIIIIIIIIIIIYACHHLKIISAFLLNQWVLYECVALTGGDFNIYVC